MSDREPTQPADIDPKAQAVLSRYRGYLRDGVDPREWSYAWRTEINRGGFRAVDFLMDEIVDAGKCVGCASCLTICPADVFDFADPAEFNFRMDPCKQVRIFKRFFRQWG